MLYNIKTVFSTLMLMNAFCFGMNPGWTGGTTIVLSDSSAHNDRNTRKEAVELRVTVSGDNYQFYPSGYPVQPTNGGRKPIEPPKKTIAALKIQYAACTEQAKQAMLQTRLELFRAEVATVPIEDVFLHKTGFKDNLDAAEKRLESVAPGTHSKNLLTQYKSLLESYHLDATIKDCMQKIALCDERVVAYNGSIAAEMQPRLAKVLVIDELTLDAIKNDVAILMNEIATIKDQLVHQKMSQEERGLLLKDEHKAIITVRLMHQRVNQIEQQRVNDTKLLQQKYSVLNEAGLLNNADKNDLKEMNLELFDFDKKYKIRPIGVEALDPLTITSAEYALSERGQQLLNDANISHDMFTQKTGNFLEQSSHERMVQLVNKSAECVARHSDDQLVLDSAHVAINLAGEGIICVQQGDLKQAFAINELGNAVLDYGLAVIGCKGIVSAQDVRVLGEKVINGLVNGSSRIAAGGVKGVQNFWHTVKHPVEAFKGLYQVAVSAAEGMLVLQSFKTRAEIISNLDSAKDRDLFMSHVIQDVQAIEAITNRLSEHVASLSAGDLLETSSAIATDLVLSAGLVNVVGKVSQVAKIRSLQYLRVAQETIKEKKILEDLEKGIAKSIQRLDHAINDVAHTEALIAGTEMKISARSAEAALISAENKVTDKLGKLFNPSSGKSVAKAEGAAFAEGAAIKAAIEAPNSVALNNLVTSGSEFAGINVENCWCMSEKGCVINGRYYTKHALERMAPDTIQVRAELEMRAIMKGYKQGTGEFKKYVQPRGIPPILIEEIIKSVEPIVGVKPNTWEYTTDAAKIILNQVGDVVTIFPQ